MNLYLHVPFCAAKCAYCAFYSAIGQGEYVDPYLKLLTQQLAESGKTSAPLNSVYLGGGTPTLLSAEQLERIFISIKDNFKLTPDCEISIECNPETLNADKARIIAEYATRVSMGVQTFNPTHRKMIGRIGDVNAVYTALDLLKQNNFTNISLDLIYAIPNQTISDWEADLRTTAELGPHHISAYSLSVEEGAALSGTDCSEAESDISFEMWEHAEKILSEYGLQRYEISNYAKPGFECRHNSNIWSGESYLGLGPSAVSFDGNNRWEQPGSLKDWLNGVAPEIDRIDSNSRAREIFIMGLRTAKGWSRKTFKAQTGFDYTPWLSALGQFSTHDFFNHTDNSFSLTTEGLAFWNTIAEELI